MSHATTSAITVASSSSSSDHTFENRNNSKQHSKGEQRLRSRVLLRGTTNSHHDHHRHQQHHQPQQQQQHRRIDAVVKNVALKSASSAIENGRTQAVNDVESLSMKSKDMKTAAAMEVDSKAAKITTADTSERIARLQSKSTKKTVSSNSNVNKDTTFEIMVGPKDDDDNDVSNKGQAPEIILDPEEREIFDGEINKLVPQKCLKPKAAKLPPIVASSESQSPPKPLTTTTPVETRIIDPNTGEETHQQHSTTKPTPLLPPPPKKPLPKNATNFSNSTIITNTDDDDNDINNTSRSTTNATTNEATLGSSINTNNTTQDAVVNATAAVEIIEYENICDMYGNLIPSETSYAPTITPAIDGDDEDQDKEEEDITDLPALADNDHDGLTNEKEILLGTDPLNSDSDTDGLEDGQEVSLGMDPLLTDTDMDGRTDYEEVLSPDVLDTMDTADNDGDGLSNTVESESGGFGTDPDVSDTDGDGLSDGMEVSIQGTDPILSDTDGDTLSDYDEAMIHGTNPLTKDSDGDGMSDGFEIQQGLDPLVSNLNVSSEVGGFSPGCEIWSKNEWGTIYTTSISASVNFMYEVSVSEDSNLTSIIESMENNMARMVGGELIQCESNSTRNLREHRQQQRRRRRHLLVDGIDKMPQDIVTEMACTYFTPDSNETPSNSSCYVIQGLMTLYLREDSALTSALQSSSEALKTILDAMNKDDPSPFLENSGDGLLSVNGVKGVRYIKGTPDEGGIVLIDNSGNQDSDEDGDDVDGAKEEGEELNSNEARSAGESLSTLGISLVAIGAAAVIGTLVAATVLLNKRKRSARGIDSKYAEFSDDENDLDMKHHSLDATTDMDASSMRDGSTPMSKRSRQMDWEGDGAEEDSVFSGLDNDMKDVNNPNPTFVHTPNDMNDAGSVAMTTYEQGYEMAIPPIFLEERLPARRYQASPIERPMYDNPLGIRKSPEANGRDYYVGNTVEF